LDENGRLKYERFEKGGDGASVVAEAAAKYLGTILNQRLRRGADGLPYNVKRLAPDERARLENGYFGITTQGISQAAAELKENFTPEALKKVFKETITQAQTAIRKTPLTLANTLDQEEVLKYVGLKKGHPLYDGARLEGVQPIQLLSLLDIYRNEKAVGKSALQQLGLYKG